MCCFQNIYTLPNIFVVYQFHDVRLSLLAAEDHVLFELLTVFLLLSWTYHKSWTVSARKNKQKHHFSSGYHPISITHMWEKNLLHEEQIHFFPTINGVTCFNEPNFSKTGLNYWGLNNNFFLASIRFYAPPLPHLLITNRSTISNF